MPSNAFKGVLTPLLTDVKDLIGAHALGRTGQRGRQWHLSGLNRSIIVMSVSAWEAYIEQVVLEAVEALRPTSPPLGTWPALKAAVSSASGRFNTPNPENVRTFIRDSIGLADVTTFWVWQRTTSSQASQRLTHALRLRHQIAHGVHPRPTVKHAYAKTLPDFFEHLASRTDEAIRDHLSTLGVSVVW